MNTPKLKTITKLTLVLPLLLLCAGVFIVQCAFGKGTFERGVKYSIEDNDEFIRELIEVFGDALESVDITTNLPSGSRNVVFFNVIGYGGWYDGRGFNEDFLMVGRTAGIEFLESLDDWEFFDDNGGWEAADGRMRFPALRAGRIELRQVAAAIYISKDGNYFVATRIDENAFLERLSVVAIVREKKPLFTPEEFLKKVETYKDILGVTAEDFEGLDLEDMIEYLNLTEFTIERWISGSGINFYLTIERYIRSIPRRQWQEFLQPHRERLLVEVDSTDEDFEQFKAELFEQFDDVQESRLFSHGLNGMHDYYELYSFQDFGRDDFRTNFLLARTRDADTFMAAWDWDFWEDRNAVNIYMNPTLEYFLSQNGKFFIIFDAQPSETAVEIFIAIYD